ncbi:gluconate 2-dehydrogenase subunit 3 family protein [Xanthocytophaga agilis]|uniref:Gluconate 2-dehydrogenase subunit 3 family protein n=1 Tax=Xanthocytophaga agilis TaxID=3048010 RepID=A0AAE3R3V1_9BACT|nr:gluconate 2-dehydrogenase subunit 3 family protein [Xanthocytophaga agilis]MDJ1501102.1 gluconate 2-dehydrogenase subunit 3 family protein [Xanthocytophaga agilis]
MQRRSALKNVVAALGGMVALPAWATGWTPESLGPVSGLASTEEALLAEIVETIIPETSTPGAKSLKVHQYAMRMITDCYGETAQVNLKQGLVLVDQNARQGYNKPFAECDARQRLDTLSKMKDSADPGAKQFISMVKSLTIQGYMNSEYVQMNLRGYNMAPGFFHGCVPLKK